MVRMVRPAFQSRALRRVSSLILNSPKIHTLANARKDIGEATYNHGLDGKRKEGGKERINEIIPDSEEERLRYVCLHLLPHLMKGLMYCNPWIPKSQEGNSADNSQKNEEYGVDVIEISSDEEVVCVLNITSLHRDPD